MVRSSLSCAATIELMISLGLRRYFRAVRRERYASSHARMGAQPSSQVQLRSVLPSSLLLRLALMIFEQITAST